MAQFQLQRQLRATTDMPPAVGDGMSGGNLYNGPLSTSPEIQIDSNTGHKNIHSIMICNIIICLT